MTDDTGQTERSTPTAVWIVIAVLAALLVFTSTLAVLQWRRAHDLQHTAALRRTAATTAVDFGVALYSYDYTDLQAAKARVLRFATDAYAKGYDADSAAAQESIMKINASQRARATGVFLTDVVHDRAAAVVVLQTALQSTDGNRSGVTYLDVALVRQASTWKVNTARPVAGLP